MTQKLLMFPLQNDLFRITLKGNVGFKTCTLFMMLNLTLSTLGKLTNQGNFRMFVNINKFPVQCIICYVCMASWHSVV